MNSWMIRIVAITGFLMMAGCAVDNVRHGLYEGIRTYNNLQSTPSEQVGRPESLTYQDYERMRKERQEEQTR